MIFNSFDFFIFLPLVFIFYWFVFNRSLIWQNSLLVIASYMFYGWWDYRFLGLILFSTIVDYAIGLKLSKTIKQNQRVYLLWGSVFVNLGLLSFFKYYNFFVDSWTFAWQSIGVDMEISTLNIILPVGISFYTFQTLSYTIDVYNKKLEPTANFIEFAAFVSFFPQLVAGPIERATNLLPQFKNIRKFDSDLAINGLYFIIWGLFKKVVVADNCAFFVNQIFSDIEHFSSAELFVGVLLFGIQIYGDFSGYSDIAIGVARLFGITLMFNFSFPYFSRDIAEFWRRWHISLSTWFRDYVYIPLGGSRVKMLKNIRNVFVVFLVSGLWHGANWTFVIWGAIHAIMFLPLMWSNKNRNYVSATRFSMNQIPNMLGTFLIVNLTWVFFRADSVSQAFDILIQIGSFKSMALDLFYASSKSLLFTLISFISIGVLFVYECLAVQKNDKAVNLSTYSAVFIALLIIFMGVYKNPSDFIYFQF